MQCSPRTLESYWWVGLPGPALSIGGTLGRVAWPREPILRHLRPTGSSASHAQLAGCNIDLVRPKSRGTASIPASSGPASLAKNLRIMCTKQESCGSLLLFAGYRKTLNHPRAPMVSPRPPRGVERCFRRYNLSSFPLCYRLIVRGELSSSLASRLSTAFLIQRGIRGPAPPDSHLPGMPRSFYDISRTFISYPGPTMVTGTTALFITRRHCKGRQQSIRQGLERTFGPRMR